MAPPTGPDFSSAAVRSEQYLTVRSSQILPCAKFLRAVNCHSNCSRPKRTRSASPLSVSRSGKHLHATTGRTRSATCIYIGCKRSPSTEIHNTVMIANSPGAAPPHQQFPPQHPQWPPGTQLPESSQPPPYYSEPLPVPRKA
ncbi:uncharacterized protein LOC144162765 isoform X1 [Haemaphysalis longicornis]